MDLRLVAGIVALFAANPPQTSTTPRLGQAELRADLRKLVRLLDESHPDPFTAGGGRIAFYRRADEALRAIPEAGLTSRQFLRLTRPLVASVRDGHTKVFLPAASQSNRGTWIELDAIDEHLYVSGVYRPGDRPLLGGLVVSVEGVPWKELVERTAAFRGADNAYNNLDHLAEAIRVPDTLEDLLGLGRPLDKVHVEVEFPGGRRLRGELPVALPLPKELMRPESTLRLPAANAADLGWGFLREDRSVAYVRIDSMMRYREAFELWRATGYQGGLGDPLTQVARAAAGREPPAGVDERIALVPSATELFRELFAAMREAKTQALVIDLRNNGGGNSLLSYILAFHLAPPERLMALEEGYEVPRYSKLYFDNYSVPLEKLRGQTSNALLESGDFDFGDERQFGARRANGLSAQDRQRWTARIDEIRQGVPTFGRELERIQKDGAWSGKLVVLTSGRTYSAGFDAAVSVARLGATVMGVPSAQAGNCYIDSLSFELEHSGVRGTLSYKRSLLFPDDPSRGALLRPDRELTYKELAGMGFDPNASVRLALDALGAQRAAR